MKKDKSLSIFDFLNAITKTKKDLTTHPDFEKEYNPFMINRWLSMETSLVYAAVYGDSLLNNSNIDKKLHFKFLQNVIDQGSYFIQYKKAIKDDGDINLITEYFNVNYDRAKEINYLLNVEQIEKIKQSFGGKK